MEYCPHGNIREFLRNSRSRYNVEADGFITDLSQAFGPKNVIHFGFQIVKGLKFLVSRKVIFSLTFFRIQFHLERKIYVYSSLIIAKLIIFPFCCVAGDSPRSGCTKYFDWRGVCRKSRRLRFGQRCSQIPRIFTKVIRKLTLDCTAAERNFGSPTEFNTESLQILCCSIT